MGLLGCTGRCLLNDYQDICLSIHAQMRLGIPVFKESTLMTNRVRDQLNRLGIRDDSARNQKIQSSLSDLWKFRECLWSLEQHAEVVRFVRSTISAELSRKLEHIITPPKAMGLAEEVSLDSIKWFVEYWWRVAKEYSPDLYVAQDNTVIASWWVKRVLIQIRFFSSGYTLAFVRHIGKGQKGQSRFLIPTRELPNSFVW